MTALTALLTLLTLSAAGEPARPRVGVAIISDRAGAGPMSETLATQLQRALVREGLDQTLEHQAVTDQVRETGASEPRSCKGARSCAQKVLVLLGARAALVTVDVGRLGSTVAVHLEALLEGSERPVEVTDLTLDTDGLQEKAAVPLTLFARTVAQKLAARWSRDSKVVASDTTPPVPPPASTGSVARTPPADAPVDGWTRPPLTPVDAASDEYKAFDDSPSRAPAVVVTAVAGVAAAAAVAFLVVGLTAKGQYDSARDGAGTTLTRYEADQLAGRANTSLTVALVGGSVAAAAGILSGVLWTR